MLYDVRVRISYTYQAPTAGRHLLRLFPVDISGVQRAIATDISIHPLPDERSVFTDFFGNQTQDVAIRQPHKALDVRVNARISREQRPQHGESGIRLSGIQAAADACSDLGPQSAQHFLGASTFVRPSTSLRNYALTDLPHDADVQEIVRLLGERIHRDMTFDPKATTISTPHEVAYEKKRGVCQDFTHIMIACLRGIGIPAGYVSGLLRTYPAAGQQKLSGADAMHAWVRAWCGPTLGWIEYDPTNAMSAGQDHITIAVGRDYFDVSPIKGVLRTVGQHQHKQAIDVIPIE